MATAIARCIARDVNPGHAAFFRDRVAYDAALFIAFATERFPQVRALNAACGEKKRCALQNTSICEADALQIAIIVALKRGDFLLRRPAFNLSKFVRA
jgi:hypothetical protein